MERTRDNGDTNHEAAGIMTGHGAAPADPTPASERAGAMAGGSTPAGPERMRAAVADYVAAMHEAYVRQARTLSPGDRARLPLLGGRPLHVAAVGTRHLHLVGTHEGLGAGPRGTTATVEGSFEPLRWTLAFYDPVVVPALGTIDEGDEPAFEEVRRVLGIGTHVYHLVLQPRSGLDVHRAAHTGTGLANSHSAAARALERIERAVGPERAPLAREMAAASRAGLPRAASLVAAALAPEDEGVRRLADRAAGGEAVDAAELRRAVLDAVLGTPAVESA